ncbi:hypothetical protein Q7C_234 [Methylophaga frappieri]|jgi:hypothetical protein|uniref:Uncharacterized protein n=1 Tax=Methylophaga frappieri (strain ATCC BAA-2434 / DSM 25690 / JAM7) TaxID=754477 RepID=I1YES0_METFJ|nr:hypothetical protein [Methylophaga frappieri]AFJ01413.1 hypothetical protein Q7C_234 [Methylophaga frappieri]
MKLIVNVMQLLIISALLYPVAYWWETDQITQRCEALTTGMTQDEVSVLTDSFLYNRQIIPQEDNHHWHWQLVSRTSFSGFHCALHGRGNRLAEAHIEENATH